MVPLTCVALRDENGVSTEIPIRDKRNKKLRVILSEAQRSRPAHWAEPLTPTTGYFPSDGSAGLFVGVKVVVQASLVRQALHEQEYSI